jgi:hypothetical protein
MISSEGAYPDVVGADIAPKTSAWAVRPVCWKTLDGASTERELRVLDEWIRWLVRRYALTPAADMVLPCWYRHGTIVEELSALHTGWLAAFAPDAPGSAPLDWHAMFAGTQTRLRETRGRSGCMGKEHREEHMYGWAAADDDPAAAPRHS